MYEDLLNELASSGWTIRRADPPVALPSAVSVRYSLLPAPISTFLCSLDVFTNPDATAWLLCGSDYAGVSKAAFAWNELELQTLAAAEGDLGWRAEIRSFWDKHFPIMLSVKDGYAYFALRLEGSHAGSVVQGVEPEFEDTEIVAPSFSEFLQLLVLASRGEAENRAV